MNVILDRTHPGGFRGYILRFQDGEDGHESHIPCLLFLSSNKCSSTNWNRIHKLKNLTQTIMYSLRSKRIFFPTNVVGTSVIGKQRMRKKIYQESSTSTSTWCQSVEPKDVPRDFSSVIAFGAKVQIPVARQGGREGGREMSAPGHMWQIPFIHSVKFLMLSHFYIYQRQVYQFFLPSGPWKCVLIRRSFENCACALAVIVFSRFRANSVVLFCSMRYTSGIRELGIANKHLCFGNKQTKKKTNRKTKHKRKKDKKSCVSL